MKKLIILCAILLVVSMVPMAAAAITVDGHKSPGEWNENWAYNQTQGTGYDTHGPFGDNLVIRQGAFSYPTTDWYDIDPQDDSGPSFSDTMSTAGIVPSGYDIKSLSMRYDPVTDTMYGLGEVYGTPGDLDGDDNVSEDDTVNGDGAGDPTGPAGLGIGSNESWEIRASQNGNDVYILVSNNNWTVFNEIDISHAEVEAKFTTSGVEPVYEIAIMGMSTHFDLTPGANPIMLEIKAGGGRDVPGEDTATAFVYLPDPAIDIEKSTNGADADTPTGPVVDMGDPITWKYVITNTGVDPLRNIVVTDNMVGNIVLPNTTLEPGDFMIATNLSTATVYGQYSNLATVDGDFVGIPVTDNDPSHYYVFEPNPAIDIEKHTNGHDADHPRGPYLNLGDPVTWEYIVTNTGDVTLSNIVVIDDKVGLITLPNTTLISGDSMIATNLSTVTDYGQYENEAEVTGDYNAITVSDMDPSHYYCPPPTEVPALTPIGLMGLIGLLGIIGIIAVKRRN